jgi:hypothetical protein
VIRPEVRGPAGTDTTANRRLRVFREEEPEKHREGAFCRRTFSGPGRSPSRAVRSPHTTLSKRNLRAGSTFRCRFRNYFVFDLRLRLLWLAEFASSDCLHSPFLHFAAFRFSALPVTTLPSSYPLGIPCGLPSRMKCFQDIRVKAFLAICLGSMWNLELCSLLGYPERFRKLTSLLSTALQLNH